MDGNLPLGLFGQTSATVFASRLAFLSEFRDYLLFGRQDARDRAAGRLVNLLTAGIAPVRFWAVILVESIPLLEGQFVSSISTDWKGELIGSVDQDILFTSNDTFELMRVLEDVELNSKYAPDEYLSDLSQHLSRKAGIEGGVKRTENGPKRREDFDEARRKLEEVRLAMARNLARALVVNFDNPF